MDYRLPDLNKFDLIGRTEEKDIMVLIFKKKSEEFLSPITEETETLPDMGDLAILWNSGNEDQAIIARVADKEYAAELRTWPYMANTGKWYMKGIRFRNQNQYNKILKYKGNVAEEAKED